MHNHLDAPHCELSFNIADQKRSRLLLSPQYRIHVANGEATHEQVSLFT